MCVHADCALRVDGSHSTRLAHTGGHLIKDGLLAIREGPAHIRREQQPSKHSRRVAAKMCGVVDAATAARAEAGGGESERAAAESPLELEARARAVAEEVGEEGAVEAQERRRCANRRHGRAGRAEVIGGEVAAKAGEEEEAEALGRAVNCRDERREPREAEDHALR